MSRGLGRVQRVVADLIAAKPDGAWTTAMLCNHVYGRDAEKKHRVAVIRALMLMQLPEPWTLRRGDRTGCELCLVNACSVESLARRIWLEADSMYDFDEWKGHYPHRVERAREQAQEAQRYCDASPVEKIDIDIANLQKTLGLLGMVGARERFTETAKQIADLQAKKAELTKAAKLTRAAERWRHPPSPKARP
jgi:hypothetical protein